MVAAQWGETRDPDARAGGGVAGRIRLLGGSGEQPDTTPPPFGTAPWGYRRSEVDAWASWVAGLVAHGRNETVRADSAEATLQATLERLRQLEQPSEPAGSPATGTEPPSASPEPPPDGPAGNETAPDRTAGNPTAGDRVTPSADPGTRGSGRLHFRPPADLPRRPGRSTTPSAPAADGTPGPASADGPAEQTAPAAPPPRDPDLARLHVVETTLHEVLELLHHLADRERRPAGP